MNKEEALPETTTLSTAVEASAEAVAEAAVVHGEAPEAGWIESIGQELEEANRKAEEHRERWLRTQAEMENLRRRSEMEIQKAHKFALESFARELLNVVDSLELGLAASTGDSADVLKLREGTELTLKQLLAVLEKFQIRPIDPVGEKFNPDLHQAMAMQPSETAEPNTVVKVFQKGWRLNDRLLRPAMVIIAQAAVQIVRIDEQA